MVKIVTCSKCGNNFTSQGIQNHEAHCNGTGKKNVDRIEELEKAEIAERVKKPIKTRPKPSPEEDKEEVDGNIDIKAIWESINVLDEHLEDIEQKIDDLSRAQEEKKEEEEEEGEKEQKKEQAKHRKEMEVREEEIEEHRYECGSCHKEFDMILDGKCPHCGTELEVED